MKKILMVLIMVGAVFSFSCQKSVDTNDPKVVAVWGDQPKAEGTTVEAYLRALNDKFAQAHPDDSVVWIASQDKGIILLERVRSAVEENKAPDVVLTQGGSLLAPFAESERILDLTAELADVKFCEAAKDVMKWRDKLYGVAPLYSVAGLFVNETKFSELGLKIPETIAQLEAAADALKAKGIVPFAADETDKRSISYLYMYLVNRIGGDVIQQSIERKLRFDSPVYIQAGHVLQDWAKKGYFGDVPLTGDATELMTSGKAAMQVSGTWMCPVYGDAAKTSGTIGFYPFPVMRGGKGATTDILGATEVAFVGITKSSVKRSLVDRFMHAAMAPEALKGVTDMISSDPGNPPSDRLLAMAAKIFYSAKNFQFYWEKELPTTTTGPAVSEMALSCLLPDTDVKAAATKFEQTAQIEMGGVVDW
ncbi:MAG: extracellular solute-binding protein [Spirochaetales bacterium]|nr:extracellular solute-binding protein [Spirochaetales bacterium]